MSRRAVIVVLCGAGDWPIPELGGRTPLEAARTPSLDRLASAGRQCLVEVIGRSIPPESDSGAMALLGYDPLVFYSGRGPLEGLGMGFLSPSSPERAVCFRINFASYDHERRRLDRRTARDLSPADLSALVQELRMGVTLEPFGDARFQIHGFARHRGILCFESSARRLSGAVSNTDPGFRKEGPFGVPVERHPPQPLPCLPLDGEEASSRTAGIVNAFLERAHALLRASPVNRRRMRDGKLPANVLLLRDGGTVAPSLVRFGDRFGCRLAMFGQLPAERGLCLLLGGVWRDSAPPDDTHLGPYYRQLAGKLAAEDAEVVFVHVKGPDEPAHDQRIDAKVAAIEVIDEELIAGLAGRMRPDDVIVVTSDHRTPCTLGIHSADRVPLLLAGADVQPDSSRRFTEREAARGHLALARACDLMPAVAPGLARGHAGAAR